MKTRSVEPIMATAFLASVFCGDVYFGITLPVGFLVVLAIGILVIYKNGATALRPRFAVILLAALLLIPAAQAVMGTVPTRFDVGTYLPVLYAVVAYQIMSFVHLENKQVGSALLGGAAILVLLAVIAAIWIPPTTQIIPGQDISFAEQRLSEVGTSPIMGSSEPHGEAVKREILGATSMVVLNDEGAEALYAYKSRIRTALGSSNYVAVFLLLAFSVALFSRKYVISAILAGCLIATMSRFGIVFLGAPIAVFALSRIQSRAVRAMIVGAGFLTAAIAALVVVFALDINWQSMSLRFELFTSALRPIADAWLLGQPRSQIVLQFGYPASWHPHNAILWATVIFGVVGLAAYLTYLAVVGSSFWALRSDPVWAGIGVAFGTLLLWGMVEVIFLTPAFSLLLGALGGLAYNRTRSENTH